VRGLTAARMIETVALADGGLSGLGLDSQILPLPKRPRWVESGQSSLVASKYWPAPI
jgi:hypothetical protein